MNLLNKETEECLTDEENELIARTVNQPKSYNSSEKKSKGAYLAKLLL